MKKLMFACALALVAGCAPGYEIRTSSLDYVPPSQSGAVSAHAPVDAARELTRLFEVRGYTLADEHQFEANGYAMKFGNHSPRHVGSVFYVWVQPTATTGSMITMFGRPTLDGAEPCSNEQPALACSGVTVNNPDWGTTALSGHAEADVVHGVLSELALEGFATGALPALASPVPGAPAPVDPAPVDPAPVDPATCEVQRTAVFAQADAVIDLEARAQLLQSAPICTAPVIQTAE